MVTVQKHIRFKSVNTQLHHANWIWYCCLPVFKRWRFTDICYDAKDIFIICSAMEIKGCCSSFCSNLWMFSDQWHCSLISPWANSIRDYGARGENGSAVFQLKVGQNTAGGLIWPAWFPTGRNSYEAAGSTSCGWGSSNRLWQLAATNLAGGCQLCPKCTLSRWYFKTSCKLGLHSPSFCFLRKELSCRWQF